MMYGNSWAPYVWGNWNLAGMGAFLGFFLVPFVIWSLVWKGWALWVAAKRDSKWWFIALLVINTAGILEILYIFVFSKMKGSSRSSRSRSRK